MSCHSILHCANRYLLPLLILTGAACSDNPPEPTIPERSNIERGEKAKLPITQIRQTLNLSPQQTFEATIGSFQRRGVQLGRVDGAAGSLESDWVTVTDSLCGSARRSQAPLPCRVRYSVKVEPLRPQASTFHIRYREICSGSEEIELVCAESSAEKLMISISEELKTLDEEAFPGR